MDLFQELFACIRDSSKTRLNYLSRQDTVEISEISAHPIVYSHWMAMILVSGPSVRIVFKTHFLTEAARQFAARPFGVAPEKLLKRQALGFLKEFCNLTAGHVKQSLSLSGVQVGVSLPTIARGFDEVYYPQRSGERKDVWILSTREHSASFICSAHVEIKQPFQLIRNKDDSQETLGDVTFL